MSTHHVSQRILGRVKWFNNKLGYGFISYNLDSSENKDIFVHWSHLSIPEKEFHTLYQGEYVEFEIIPCEGDEKKKQMTQAHNVTGPQGGPLMATSNKTMMSIAQGTFVTNVNSVFKVQQVEHNVSSPYTEIN
jgi:cold shock CspA family protein